MGHCKKQTDMDCTLQQCGCCCHAFVDVCCLLFLLLQCLALCVALSCMSLISR